MQYGVTHRCGHSERVQLYGSGRDREHRLGRMRAEPCADCRRGQHEGDNAEAAMLSSLEGLPRLSGSERQIAWAETVRRDLLARAEALIAGAAATPRGQEEPAMMVMWAARLAALRRQSSASWWIEMRTYDPQVILGQAVS